MSPFKNDAQRKAAFANMNARDPPRPKTSGVVNSPRVSKKLVEKPNSDNILKKWRDEQRNKKLQNALTWSGCLAFPNHCLVIKGVNQAYILYKQNSNTQNKIENLLKVGVQNFATDITENERKRLSEEIVKHANDSGLIDIIYKTINKKTDIDKNTIEFFIEGTTSNLLQKKTENGVDFLLNMW